MNNSARDRFHEVMDILELTDYRVYTDIKGITKNMMVKLRNGETEEVSIKILSPFCTKFENVNSDYILTGRGEPLKKTEATPVITNLPATDKDIKILDIRVSAGHGLGFEGDENNILGYVSIPNFSGCYGVTVYGDSMYNKYSPGDIVFVREIINKHEIEGGQVYVVITNEDRYIKMIYIEDDGLKLVSYNNTINPDGRRKYPDMMIDGNQINFLYKVVGRLERTQI